jgi:hypothetical protein
MACPFGFRLLGPATGDRRLVDWQAAFAAYASCDPRCQPDQESYLSGFTFGEDFRARADEWGTVSTAGFNGPCWAPWIWFDLDRTGNIDLALKEARRLAMFLDERFALRSEDDLLAFLSGNKGFHLGAPTSLWCPEPAVDFHRIARRFACRLAELAGVGVYDDRRGYRIDEGVYVKVQLFRAPNSRHPRSGRHKRRLLFSELMSLSVERILQLAEGPEPFDIPTPDYRSEQAGLDWADAVRAVAQETEARQRRQPEGAGKATLNRLTREFLCKGASEGDRHRLLFSAASNLAEFRCPPLLAHALLTEPALDSGLSPSDVHRQIECGLRHGSGPGDPEPSACPTPPADLRAALSAAWSAQATPTGVEPASWPAGLPPPPSAEDSRQIPADPPPRTEPTRVPNLRAELTALWASAAGDRRETPVAGAPEPIALPEGFPAKAGRADAPCPPPGVRFFYEDERGRVCGPAAAAKWTWAGATRWYYVAEFPLP